MQIIMAIKKGVKRAGPSRNYYSLILPKNRS